MSTAWCDFSIRQHPEKQEKATSGVLAGHYPETDEHDQGDAQAVQPDDEVRIENTVEDVGPEDLHDPKYHHDQTRDPCSPAGDRHEQCKGYDDARHQLRNCNDDVDGIIGPPEEPVDRSAPLADPGAVVHDADDAQRDKEKRNGDLHEHGPIERHSGSGHFSASLGAAPLKYNSCATVMKEILAINRILTRPPYSLSRLDAEGGVMITSHHTARGTAPGFAHHRAVRGATLAIGLALLFTAAHVHAQNSLAQLRAKVNHIVVMYQENWTFDALYGHFPGANGIAKSSPASLRQVDKSGKPLSVAPLPVNGRDVDPNFADIAPTLPLKPYDLLNIVSPATQTGDIVHRFYTQQLQIDGGKMDKFIAWSDN